MISYDIIYIYNYIYRISHVLNGFKHPAKNPGFFCHPCSPNPPELLKPPRNASPFCWNRAFGGTQELMMVLFLEDHKGPVKEEVVEICSMILWRCFWLIKMLWLTIYHLFTAFLQFKESRDILGTLVCLIATYACPGVFTLHFLVETISHFK